MPHRSHNQFDRESGHAKLPPSLTRKTENIQITRHFRTTDFHAHIQSLKLWVLEILAWMVGVIGSREGRKALCEMRNEVRRDLRELLFAMIVSRMRFRKRDGRMWTTRPRGVPRGFRFARRSDDMVKLFTRGIRLKTFAQMRAVLDDIHAVVARAFRRAPKCRIDGALVVIAPPAQILSDFALAAAPDGADTS